MKTINKTLLFLILTFTISFALAGAFRLLGGDYNNKTGFTILGAVYMFIPTICVIIVKKLIYHEDLKTDLLISFKLNAWFFVAWLLMPLIGLAAAAISLLHPDVVYSPEMLGMIKRFEPMMTPEQLAQMKASIDTLPVHPLVLTLGMGLMAGITVNAVAGFGEELGWRGFLVREFREMSFLKASVIIGFIWGIWHAPLILMGHNYPQHPQIGVLMMTAFCILLSPLFVYITIKARSVIAAAIAHGTMNATAGVSIMLIDGGNDLTVGITGMAGFITMAIVLGGLFLYDRFISKDNIFTNKISKFV